MVAGFQGSLKPIEAKETAKSVLSSMAKSLILGLRQATSMAISQRHNPFQGTIIRMDYRYRIALSVLARLFAEKVGVVMIDVSQYGPATDTRPVSLPKS